MYVYGEANNRFIHCCHREGGREGGREREGESGEGGREGEREGGRESESQSEREITLSVFGTFFIQVRSHSPIYTTDGCQAFATCLSTLRYMRFNMDGGIILILHLEYHVEKHIQPCFPRVFCGNVGWSKIKHVCSSLGANSINKHFLPHPPGSSYHQ